MTPEEKTAPGSRGNMPQLAAATVVTLAALAYSFRLVSFVDAKLLVLALGAPPLAILLVVRRDVRLFVPHSYVPVVIGLAFAAAVHPWAASAVSAYTLEWAIATSLILIVAFLVVNAFGARRDLSDRVIAGSAVLVAALALLQYFGAATRWFPVFEHYPQRMYSVFGNQDLLGGYLAIGAVVLAGILYRDRPRTIPGFVALAVLFLALVLSASRSAWLAAAIGVGVLMFRSHDRRRSLQITALAFLLGVAAVALVPDATIARVTGTFGPDDFGGRARLWFWDGAARIGMDRPLLGAGAGNFRYESPAYLGEALWASGPAGHVSNRVHTLHAHSDFLETVAEFGLIGVVLGVWLLIRLPWRDPVAAPALLAYLVFAALNTTLHSPPHLMAFLLLAGSAERDAGAARLGEIGRYRAMRALGILASLLLCGLTVLVHVRPSAFLAAARDAYEVDRDHAEHLYGRAVSYLWPSYSAELELAILLANAGIPSDALYFGLRAAEGLDTGDVHELLARQYENLGATDRARASYDAVVARWPRYARGWEGLLRTSPPAAHNAVLERARPWLSDRAYTALKSQAVLPPVLDPSQSGSGQRERRP